MNARATTLVDCLVGVTIFLMGAGSILGLVRQTSGANFRDWEQRVAWEIMSNWSVSAGSIEGERFFDANGLPVPAGAHKYRVRVRIRDEDAGQLRSFDIHYTDADGVDRTLAFETWVWGTP